MAGDGEQRLEVIVIVRMTNPAVLVGEPMLLKGIDNDGVPQTIYGYLLNVFHKIPSTC